MSNDELACSSLHARGRRRFLFLSSIKVNGEETHGRPFREDDTPRPEDLYGITKLEAELALTTRVAGSGMGVTIVRPPLVYGPGVKANFRRLIGLVERGVPLPLASVRNARSLVGLGNLCSLVAVALAHPAAAGETFLVADAAPVSTPELLRPSARRSAGLRGSCRCRWPCSGLRQPPPAAAASFVA